MLTELIGIEPAYEKGDYSSTARIAERYPTAVKNAEKTLHNLLQDGLPAWKIQMKGIIGCVQIVGRFQL